MVTPVREHAARAPALEPDATPSAQRHVLRHRDFTLTSVFQPVFSLSHMRAVGYEGLLRAHDIFDRPVPPLDVFGDAARHGEMHYVDRLAQSLHLENFKALRVEREWLFLNIHAGALADSYHAAAFRAHLDRLELSPRRIVIELQAVRAEDFDKLAEEAGRFREQGFLIALDDFGAGDSNLERIWQLDPDIVKVDRMMLSQAAHRTQAAAILPGFVSMLHEAGKLVLVEGVETEHEAQLAFSCDVDFVQGFYFGRPNPSVADSVYAGDRIAALAERHRTRIEARERMRAGRLAPYVRSLVQGMNPSARNPRSWQAPADIAGHRNRGVGRRRMA